MGLSGPLILFLFFLVTLPVELFFLVILILIVRFFAKINFLCSTRDHNTRVNNQLQYIINVCCLQIQLCQAIQSSQSFTPFLKELHHVASLMGISPSPSHQR